MSRGLISRGNRLKWALAGVLLVLCAGCLVPQEETVFPDLPKKENSRLKIVSTMPSDRKVTYVGTCDPGFKVSVNDPDVGDTISSKWFIDRSTNSASIDGRKVYGAGTATRDVAAPVALTNQLLNITDKADHLLEVFVTDSDFTDTVGLVERPPLGTLPDGGVWRDPAYIDSFLWVVSVNPCK
jgi:hypothetical protein